MAILFYSAFGLDHGSVGLVANMYGVTHDLQPFLKRHEYFKVMAVCHREGKCKHDEYRRLQ